MDYSSRSAARIVRPPMSDAEKVIRIPIESSIASAKQYLTPEVKAELAEQFGSYFGRSQFPALAGNRLDDFLCRRCLPHLPLEEAHRVLGYNFLLAYTQTLVLRAMVLALRVASIEQVLRFLPRNYAATYNFGSFEVFEVGPKHWRFELNDFSLNPATVQGSLEAGSYLLQNDAKYRYTVIEPGHIYFDITWEVGRLFSLQ